MSKSLVMAANWKMNLSAAEIAGYFKSFADDCKAATKHRIVFAVPYLFLRDAMEATRGKGWTIAAQNVHFASNGAYTGEISAKMLAEAGVRASLVGHSERRQYFAESDEQVAKKLQALQAAEFMTIACIGETLEERKRGETFQVLDRQLDAILKATQRFDDLILAYEPVWAIGTGVNATPEQAEEVHRHLRQRLAAHPAISDAKKLPLLYGGSVKVENVAELMRQENIDGALVGGASLVGKDFARLVNAASNALA